MFVRQSQHQRRSNFASAILFVLALATNAYFAYHLIHGKYGIEAREELNREIADIKFELQKQRAQKKVLERNIALVHPDHIDPDMMDEQIRLLLNYARPNEVVLFSPHYR